MAADLGLVPLYKAPQEPASWTGLYLGGQSGGGWAPYDQLRVGPGAAASSSGLPAGSLSAPLAGSKIGADYQFGGFVFGVMAEGDWGKLNGTPADGAVPGETHDLPLGWGPGVGGRIGYAWNNFLPYVKGGAAWDRFGTPSLAVTPAGAVAGTTPGTETRPGWFIGAGAEYRFTPNTSFFAEYGHYDFGAVTASGTTPASGAGAALGGTTTRTDVMKIGVNWRPDWTLSLP
jgi:outer membrane immunogenic protein